MMSTNNVFALGLAALLCIACIDCAMGDTFGSGANTFDIEFVTIGSHGNSADTTGTPNPAGSVTYTYRIGKFEISEQMIDEANALGGLGITKDTRGPGKPASSLSWNETARFVNWLNTSTGNLSAYKFANQPGEAGYSANADIELWAVSDVGYDPSNPQRNRFARYFLPDVNEWYKAAYFDPSLGVYYNYPTGSDSIPTRVSGGTAAGTAVYNGTTGPADITFAGGLSPFGTMAQGGNVPEWIETAYGPSRAFRGGSWASGPSGLHATFDFLFAPTYEGSFVGFRVASVIPEPNTLVLLAFGIWLAALRINPAGRRS